MSSVWHANLRQSQFITVHRSVLDDLLDEVVCLEVKIIFRIALALLKQLCMQFLQ